MKRFFALALLASRVGAQSYGVGPSITWYLDSAHTQPARGAMQGQKLYGVLSSAATAASMYGHSIGSVTLTDSTHVTYTTPASVVPTHPVDGLQPLPNDDIFFTPINALPLRSDQGDPTKGTGQYTALEPSAAFLSANNYPSCTATPGSSAGCHLVLGSLTTSTATTTTATILRNPVPPSTWHMKSVYGQSQANQPDVRGTFYENRQTGNYHIPAVGCNIGTAANYPNSLEKPNPPFANCVTGNSTDMHEFMVDPINLTNYESYGDLERAGAYSDCIGANPAVRDCTVSSWRHVDWSTYAATGGMGVAGTPENQLELTGEDLYRAHDGQSIGHVFVYAKPVGYQTFGYRWPAVGQQGGLSTVAYGPQMGSRMRFSSTRFDQTGASGITVVNAGTGYTPGSVLTFNISGCTSIDGTNPASGIAWIGTNGQIANLSNHDYAAVTNTGKNCASPTATLPAPPSGGTQATVTILTNWPGSTQNPWNDPTTGVQVLAQAQQYGWELDDNAGGVGPNMRRDGTATINPYWSTFSQFVGSGSSWNNYGNPYLWEEVDESSLQTTAWGTTAGKNLWAADSANSYEGQYVHNQAVVQLTSSGGNSFTPIPVLGVAVGFVFGNQPDRISIMSGMSAFNLTAHAYVTGDPTNAGMTWTMATDPCPGDSAELLNATTGMYTPCAQFDGSQPKQGLLKATSKANANAYVYVDLFVVSTDGAGNLRVDSGGGGGCTGTSVSGSTCVGGVWYSKDVGVQMTTYQNAKNNGCSYPNWSYFKFPIATAPNATPGELGKNALATCVYVSYDNDSDVTYSFAVPNGNYQIRSMFARDWGGSTGAYARVGGSAATTSPYPNWDQLYTIDTQGDVKLHSYCFLCLNNYQAGQPVDVYIPAKVTDNVLNIGFRGQYMSRYAGWAAWEMGPAEGQDGLISAINVLADTSTAPRWDIHAYVPNDDGTAMDNFYTWIFPLNNGNTTTWTGAIPPGVFQFYIEDWFTGVNDPTWSIVSGPGSITPAGFFVSPTTQPLPGGTCTVVKATSKSASYSATQTVCYSGATSYAFH